MKTQLLLAGILLASQASYALRIEPGRCAADNLGQWTEGTPIAGTARGRNAWLNVCQPERYDTLFAAGNEFDELGSGRRLYPTFGIIKGVKDGKTEFNYAGWFAPTDAPGSADSAACTVAANHRFVGLCTSGCVTPDSAVESAQGRVDIMSMSESSVQETLVPTQSASGALRLDVMEVQRYIKDLADAVQDILLIKTVSGGEIKVSKNHPLLKGDYKMAKAEDLKVGDSLVTAEGKKDLIVEVSENKYFGKLYNLTIKTDELSKSLFVVQGYISGDKKFQDIEVSSFNRKIFREIAAEAM